MANAANQVISKLNIANATAGEVSTLQLILKLLASRNAAEELANPADECTRQVVALVGQNDASRAFAKSMNTLATQIRKGERQ